MTVHHQLKRALWALLFGLAITVSGADVTPPIATFTSARTVEVGRNPSAVAIADLDLDGTPDIVVANQYDPTFSFSVVIGGAPKQGVATNYVSRFTFPIFVAATD